MTLGSRIREARERIGLSQADVARAMKISPAAISQWEADETKPATSRLAQLPKLLQVDAAWLFGDDQSPAQPAGPKREFRYGPPVVEGPRDLPLLELFDFVRRLPVDDQKKALRLLRATFGDEATSA